MIGAVEQALLLWNHVSTEKSTFAIISLYIQIKNFLLEKMSLDQILSKSMIIIMILHS